MPRAQVYADILRRLLRSGARSRAEKVLAKLHAADAADVVCRLPTSERRPLVDLIVAVGRAGEVLTELPDERMGEVLELVDDKRLAAVLGEMAPDDAAFLFERLGAERRTQVLPLVAQRARVEIERLRTYPAGTAGSVMTTRVFALPTGATSQEAIERLRERDDAEPESIYYLYIVDEDGRLGGVVPVRKLVAARADRPVGELAIADPVAVEANDSADEAARIVARYNLLAVPVVDKQRRLVGMITVDDVIDVIQEQATQALYGLSGLSENDRIFTTAWQSIRKRLSWMIINLGTEFLVAWVVGLFQASIAQMVALAVFLPVVSGMGGNAGTQALTVVTRGVALGELMLTSGLRAVWKEIIVGLVIGGATGLITGAIAWPWTHKMLLGFALFVAMIVNLAVAGFFGAVIPLFLRSIKRDPALGGSVILTTFTDCCGNAAFLGIATLLMKYMK